MMRSIDHFNYPVSSDNENNCFWPRFHKDLETMEKDGAYMGTKIDHMGSRHAGQTRLPSLNSGNVELRMSL